MKLLILLIGLVAATPVVQGISDTNILDLILYYFPWLAPNSFGAHDGRHDIDKGHLVEHDFRMSFQDIVEENGYSYESHETETDDGYVLTIFRIRKQGLGDGAPVVFLQHGLLDTADAWIINHPDNSPAFMLAKSGYDVWLGNQRGNRYSRNHTYLDPDSRDYGTRRKFFSFSWQEMGEYDAPAMIDFVLENTGRQNLTWIGHSTGNTQIFYGLAFEKQYYFASKINLFVALAPLTRVNHVESWTLKFFANHADTILWISDKLGWYETGTIWSQEGFKFLCGTIPLACRYGESFFLTDNTELDDSDRFQVYMGHLPGGSSLKSFEHIGQNLRSGRFELYDYNNQRKNEVEYGNATVPEVDLEFIQESGIKIAMVAGLDDEVANIMDARWARQQLTPPRTSENHNPMVYYEEINGGYSTFFVGLDMSYFQRVIALVGKYNL